MITKKSEVFSELFELAVTSNAHYRILIRRRFKENKIDVTVEMLQVLNCLWKEDRRSQQEIADVLLKDKVSMTYLIDNLSKRKLVTRQESKTDRRIKIICLTSEGRALQEPSKKLLNEIRKVTSAGISKEELEACISYYRKMSENIKRELS